MKIIQIVDCNNYDGFQQLGFIFSSKFVNYFIAYLMTKLTLGYRLFDIEIYETTYLFIYLFV
jgi:hypothetical protein